MLINLSEILSVPQKNEEFSVTFEGKNISFQGTSYEVLKTPEFVLDITNIHKGIIGIKGQADVTLILNCVRCLKDVPRTFHLDIDREVDFNKLKDKDSDYDEISYIEDCTLDVDMLILDEIIPLIPIGVLCKEDCKGLCKVCGTNLNENSCDCDQTVPDPRLSVISDIFNNFKEV